MFQEAFPQTSGDRCDITRCWFQFCIHTTHVLSLPLILIPKSHNFSFLAIKKWCTAVCGHCILFLCLAVAAKASCGLWSNLTEGDLFYTDVLGQAVILLGSRLVCACFWDECNATGCDTKLSNGPEGKLSESDFSAVVWGIQFLSTDYLRLITNYQSGLLS